MAEEDKLEKVLQDFEWQNWELKATNEERLTSLLG